MGNFMSCVLICGAMEVVQVVNTNGRVEKLIRPIRAAELIWAHEKYKAALAAGLNPAAAAAAAAAAATEDDDHHVAKDKNNNKGAATGVAAAPEDKANKYVLLPLSNPKDDPNNNNSSSKSSSSISDVGCRAYKFQCLSEENVSTQHHKKQGSSRSHSSSSSSSSSSKQKQQQQMPSGGNPPFKVKKEGGVTTLVVSKRYLEQLLSDKELRTTEMGSGDTCTTQAADAAPQELLPKLVPSSRPPRRSSLSRSGRVSIWRPALESISEAHNNNSSSSSSNHHHHHHHRHQRQQF